MKNYRHISEKPVVAASDWKRAAIWFDDWRPVPWCRIDNVSELDDLVAEVWDDHFERSLGDFSVHIPRNSIAITQVVSAIHTLAEDSSEESSLIAALAFFKEMRSADNPNRKLFEDLMRGFDETIIAKMLTSEQDRLRYYSKMSGFELGEFDLIGAAMATELESSNVDLALSNLTLVDTDRLTWEQIFHLRSDKEALRQLRQLRRFVVSDMQGWSSSDVQEELESALDEHQQAAKKWGLARSPSELEIDCDASMVVGLLAALGAATTGNPLAIGIALGSVIPLGQNLVKINRGRKKVLENSRVSYLVRLQEEAEKGAEPSGPPDRIEPTV
ncbi:MAG: hypothetical protein NXH85_13565 [Pseudomonadaceae bacterium]|nr:hypothetical protein [Pseudomonadaceae bacterium]